jgi:hypothetical protein
VISVIQRKRTPTKNTFKEALTVNENRSYSRKIWKMAVAALVVNAVLIVATPLPTFAEDARAKCEHRIEKAEARLDDAVRHHGERSPQADARRRDLNAEREHCWSEYHGWWDGHAHQWHTDHDWER